MLQSAKLLTEHDFEFDSICSNSSNLDDVTSMHFISISIIQSISCCIFVICIRMSVDKSGSLSHFDAYCQGKGMEKHGLSQLSSCIYIKSTMMNVYNCHTGKCTQSLRKLLVQTALQTPLGIQIFSIHGCRNHQRVSRLKCAVVGSSGCSLWCN